MSFYCCHVHSCSKMMLSLLLTTLILTARVKLAASADDGTMHGTFTVRNDWGHRFEAELVFKTTELVEGFVCTLTFNIPIKAMDLQNADSYSHSDDLKTWTIINKPDHMFVEAGQNLVVHFFADSTSTSSQSLHPTATGVCQNKGKDYNWSVPTLPNKANSKYNYDDVLYKSILFYEAQRSGKLPANNRIPYRGDSALNDKGAKGEDLTGGWYDAGDHVKFNFPMAFSTTMLAWGLLLYKDAYQAAGQLDHMYDSIKWPLDYLLKCHTGPNELYVQVGNADADHSYWGPPEKMTMARPAFKIDASHPGSDVAMETAAAFAAGSLAFADKNSGYSSTLLSHAKQLWEFAHSHQGKYSDSVSAAAGFYKSYNLTDEMCWGSLWLYKATKDAKYLTEARKWFDPAPAWGMSWDEKIAGNQVLMYQLTNEAAALEAVKGTYKYWFPGGEVPYSPKGLPFRLQWGSLRYASNMAAMALIAADSNSALEEYRHWAMCVIHYALGDTGFSYLIGFGNHGWPHSPHHRSSSCPNLPAPCGPFVMSSNHPNVHTLYGALVGGPDQNDAYTDSRSNYVNNEVACDYNAGFQTAVAALRSLLIRHKHPEQTGSATCPYRR
ncbi:uncharacterized protein LOC112557999 isoform X1 [Pomacea canaliculata]|uniref:uncharacterized protein LOC112557999 isoform X1 n=2 Tax=Pomacea canaliculata TaxID=400727 RepID=UPI000D728BEB|nr:uncharacterized protein LOC112557999 isoform X1 [Pomacea canaliculata]